MKYLLVLTALTIGISFCTSLKREDDNFEFGPSYDSTRLIYGSPLIKKNMKPKNCCGEWTIYEVSKVPSSGIGYHNSKTIRAITNGRLIEEKDIYRRDIDDTTLIQINLLTNWRWHENRMAFESNMGKIDKRSLQLSAKDYLKENGKYPEYGWIDLNLTEFDSTLKSWGLSRSDDY